ncbi:MAG: sigma-E factor negative regulatory protein [Gammaproteobacteria bacterium]|nr:sigma-E factor negative regulatory protein [Gammaproteobacteria bacterium]
MSDKLKENISALMDGELGTRSTGQTIDVLLESDELRVHWTRYHVVRDVLRHKTYPDSGAELCERMRSCLADEPLHFPSRRLLPRRWRETLRPVAGVALAASVAVVAILAVRGLGDLPGQPESAQAPPVQVAASRPASIIPASTSSDRPFRPAALKRLQWNTTEPAVARRLNGYLVNHSEYLGGPMRGLHPYARIVGYDSTGQR